MIRVGDIIHGVAKEFVPVGVIAEHNGHRFLITSHEWAWEPIDDIASMVSLGDSIQFLVVSPPDSNSQSLILASRRRALTTPNLWRPKPPHLLQLVDPLDRRIRHDDYQSTCAFVKSQSSELIFHALFELATRGLSKAASTSARILWDVNVDCPVSCVDIVRDIGMSSWNVSQRQLPWYVTKQFGLEATIDAIDLVRRESLTQEQWVLVDTIAYWARKRPEF